MFCECITKSERGREDGIEILGQGVERYIGKESCEERVFEGSVVDEGGIEGVKGGFEVGGYFRFFGNMRREGGWGCSFEDVNTAAN